MIAGDYQYGYDAAAMWLSANGRSYAYGRVLDIRRAVLQAVCREGDSTVVVEGAMDCVTDFLAHDAANA